MSERSNLSRGLRALAVAVALAIGGIAAGLAVMLVLGLVIGALGVQLGSTVRFGLTFLAVAAGFVGISTAYLRRRDRSLAYVGIAFPSLRGLLWAVAGYLVAIALVFLSGAVLSYFQATPDTANQAVQAGMQNPELLLWLVPLSIFVVAPAEEFLFRGVIQNRLRETFKPVVAIPLTAAIFATVHFFSLTGGAGGRFIAIGILFFPSLVFGTVYEKTENLVVPILIHGFYNSTLSVLIYASVRYAGSQPALL